VKRELDQEEAVWRSVPAFVTALGLVGALLVYIAKQVLPVDGHPAALIAVGLAVAGAMSLVIAGWNLRMAIRRRKHGYLPDEEGVVRSFQERKNYYEEMGQHSNDAGSSALRDFRSDILEKSAAAASWNHKVNSEKQVHRMRSAHWMFISATCAVVSGALAFSFSTDQSTQPRDESHDREISAPTSTSAPAAATGQVGRTRSHEPPTDALTQSHEAGGL
jgi:hypothetical protein